MKLRLLFTVLVIAGAALSVACPHPIPNPGQVVVSCAMDAVNDPAIRKAVLEALAKDNWREALKDVALTFAGGASEVVACILQSYLGQFGADPAKAKQYERARSYLHEHGYGGT